MNGFTYRQVVITDINAQRGLAICREITTGINVEVPILPIRVRAPRVGEHWILDRAFGPWSFAALLKSEDIFDMGFARSIHRGESEPTGDATTWYLGQLWVDTTLPVSIKAWDGTTWATL